MKKVLKVLLAIIVTVTISRAQGTYTNIRSYPTVTALNTVSCNPSVNANGPLAFVYATDSSGGAYQCSPITNTWVKFAAGVSSGTVTSVVIGGGLASTQSPLTTAGTLSIATGGVTNAMLANSTFTLNGATVTLGGTTTLLLASSNFANQGTTTTVLHGNAAGNPSFGSLSLTADVSGQLPIGSGGTGSTTLAGANIPVISGTPTGGNCVDWATPTTLGDAGAACGSGSGGSPGGIPGQYQINNTNFAGSTTLQNSSSDGTGTVLVQPSSDIVPSTISAPSGGTPVSDVFQVFANLSGTLTKCFWIAANGNLSFCGNNATYGTSGQATASHVNMYGGASPNAGPYLAGTDSSGGHGTYLYFDPTAAGTVSIETSIPSGAATAGNIICTPTNDLCLPTATRAGDIIYWDGSIWNHLAGNNSGTNFLKETSAGVPSWSAGTGTTAFSAITTGTNTTGLLMGAGGSLASTSTGTITANGFQSAAGTAYPILWTSLTNGQSMKWDGTNWSNSWSVVNPTLTTGQILPSTTIHICPTCQYTTVAAAESALSSATGQVVTIVDDNCLGPTYADVFNSNIAGTTSQFVGVHLTRCQFPFATNVPIQLANPEQITGDGKGYIGASQVGTTVITGPSFPASAGTPNTPVITQSAGGSSVAATYYAEVEYSLIGSSGPWSAPSAESTGVAITLNNNIIVTVTGVPVQVKSCELFVTAYPTQAVTGSVSAVGGSGSETAMSAVTPSGGTCTATYANNGAQLGDPPNDADETAAMFILGNTGKGSSSTSGPINFGDRVENMALDGFSGSFASNIQSWALTSNVVTVTTAAWANSQLTPFVPASGFGGTITIAGAATGGGGADINGSQIVCGPPVTSCITPTSTQFTFQLTHANDSSATVQGTATQFAIAGTGVFDASSQEQSGTRFVDYRNFIGAADLIVEGNRSIRGSSNSGPYFVSNFNDSTSGCTTANGSACNPTYCALFDRVNSARGLMGGTCTPNTGTSVVTGIRVNGTPSTYHNYPGSSNTGQGTHIQDFHVEGNASSMLYGIDCPDAQCLIQHVTPSTATGAPAGGAAVHLGATAFGSTVTDVAVPTSRSAIKDDINAYTSVVGQVLDSYSVGPVIGAFSGNVNSGSSWATTLSSAGGTNRSSPQLSLCGNFSVSNTQGCATLQLNFGTGNTPSNILAILPPSTGGNTIFDLGYTQINANAGGQSLTINPGAGTASLAGGSLNLNGASSAFTATAGGDVILSPGTGAGASSGTDGKTQIQQAVTTQAVSFSVGTLLCLNAVSGGINLFGACSHTSQRVWLGFALTAASGTSIHENIVSEGPTISALFDTTAITQGDAVCYPAATDGLLTDNGSAAPCTTGKGVGIVKGNISNSGGAGASADIYITRY